jgi:HK97 family phage prohead protease
MAEITFDFSGYATKNGLKCSDGRTILKDAFKHQDGKTVPLVWQHMHDEPDNVLGHAILENRDDGVYCYAKFNSTEKAKAAKELVAHGDVSSLSIYANQLEERAKNVIHGAIREVSLVLAGANPGALIDNISFAHGDGTYTESETEAVIYFDDPIDLAHADAPAKEAPAKEDKTIAEVFDTLNEEQKTVVYAMLAQAMSGDDDGGEAEHSDTNSEEDADSLGGNDDGEIKHSNEEGDSKLMKNNVFDQATKTPSENTLSHEQLGEILGDAKRYGSLKESFIAHATEYGFNPIDVLFPDAKVVNDVPQTVKREDSWVTGFLGEATHTPFSRIKTITADITADEARAKGYVTGNLKKEEIIPLLKRVTTPTTVYKKQKLDRDDITDITDFDVVVWLKAEMRGMLNEEVARAALLGDGRDIASEDKINEQNIRPIVLDNDSVYTHRGSVASTATTDDIIDEFIRIRKYYKGSGNPTLYTSTDLLTEMLLVKDGMKRRLYNNVQELASVLRVSKIVEVELMNGATRKVSDTQTNDILGVIVNMRDYTFGADKGGQVAMFDDFDIDYNQYKYLIETRLSGALTRPKSALILERTPVGV